MAKSTLGNKKIMASNIRRNLDKLGLNTKEFSNKLNFKYTTVLDWVNAKTYPRIDKIEKMANKNITNYFYNWFSIISNLHYKK